MELRPGKIRKRTGYLMWIAMAAILAVGNGLVTMKTGSLFPLVFYAAVFLPAMLYGLIRISRSINPD